ncbi:MAG: helix-turn-helix transcriptional regulator [Geobacteraceae bacterium]|nr:helix-turn-helix transcriptional regulator [Geobacteraceae bacterium]NTW81487.1 helix-turn-helix transcriptional regulator [Geobacteraceae bacterium]
MDVKIERIIDGFKLLRVWGVRGLNTQVELKTGFSASYVGQVFKGNKTPADKFIISVCDAFGINKRWVEFGEEPILNIEGNRRLLQREADFAEFGKAIKETLLISRSEHLEDCYSFLKALGITEVCIEGFKELQKMPEFMQYRAVATLKELNAGKESDSE